MPINAILFILFLSTCGLTFAVIKLYSVLTFAVIKLYSELNWLKEYIATTRDVQYKLIKEVDERCSKLHSDL